MLFSIDEHDPRPIYEQLVVQVKEQVGAGTLPPGEALPGVRELADSLSINLHTVHKAYQKLRDEGVIELRLGRRAKIAERREGPRRVEAEARVEAKLRDAVTEARALGLDTQSFKNLVERLWQGAGGMA